MYIDQLNADMNNLIFMRDDFRQKEKEVLAQRVGYLCSNPNCRMLTSGPNSQENRSTNIGVAAHITAASKGGPRYDENLTSNERKSINNGIWLCQTCSKLIDSDFQKYSKQVLIDWKIKAEIFSKLLLNKQNPEDIKRHNLLKQMPDLIKEMKDDLKKNPLFREFALLKRSWVYNGNTLCYYYEDHEDLDIKIKALEVAGLINDITWNNTKRYEFTEDFVDLLLN